MTECYIFKKEFSSFLKIKSIEKYCNSFTGKYRGAAHNISYLKLNIPEDFPVVFYSGSNFHYHFIIKELTNKFQG